MTPILNTHSAYCTVLRRRTMTTPLRGVSSPATSQYTPCSFPGRTHPEILEENKIPNYGVNMTLEEAQNYFGLFALFIYPPRGLLFPVIPYRTRQKTIYGLCKTVVFSFDLLLKKAQISIFKCMELNNQASCQHDSYFERGFHCTLNSPDLEAALELGYKALRVYQIYDWKRSQTTNDLFKNMIAVSHSIPPISFSTKQVSIFRNS